MVANIDEAFQLTDVRAMAEKLPSHVNEITTAAVAQFPRDLRKQFEPYIKDVSRRFLAPDAFYRQLRTYFVKHYDGGKMATFLALERTPGYRTMHRLEAGVETPAAEAGRRRFEANLKSDPPEPDRIAILQRMDQETKTTDLQVRMLTNIVNVMSDSLGVQLPPDLDTKTAAFAAKIQPVVANAVLTNNLYVYRNTEGGDLEDYIAAAQQPAVEWFNHTLQSAILAVSAERVAHAGEDIKTKAAQVVK